jgi:hypothetical protein
MGPQVLAKEYVAAKLAGLFGLSVPEHSIFHLEGTEFKLAEGQACGAGTCFASRWEPGSTWGGADTELRRCVNRSDVSSLMIFDTWILNDDRCHPDPGRKPRWENIFLSTRDVPPGCARLMAIDHSEAFQRPEINRHIEDIGVVMDDRIFGAFPVFANYILWVKMQEAQQVLRGLSHAAVDTIIGECHPDWGVDQRARAAWATMLKRRAEYLVESDVAFRVWTRLRPGVLPT